jgi:Holliday junction resolvase RusA-like endonuclease
MRLELFVPGVPQSKGSMSAIKPGVVIEAGSTASRARKKNWRSRLEHNLWAEHMAIRSRCFPLQGPVVVDVSFRFPIAHSRRNKVHPGEFHTQKPDIDKLLRAILDPLKESGVLTDDCVVADLHGQKSWCLPGSEGAEIVLTW